MEYKVLLDPHQVHQVEEEEKSKFIRSILENLEIPLDDIWQYNQPFLETEQRRSLKKLLEQYNIEIYSTPDAGVELLIDNEKIAAWFKPTYILKKDHLAKDFKKNIYYEMQIKFWSIFEEGE